MHRAKEHPKIAPSVIFSFFEHKTPYKKQDEVHVMFFWGTWCCLCIRVFPFKHS
jgi:hypothetical protein